jgi:hypothetical protein
MSVPGEFEHRMAERAAAARAEKQAEQAKLQQTEKEKQARLAEIAAKEEEWFPKAKKCRDDEFDEMLAKAGAELKAGGLRHKDGDRAFWSQLVSDKYEIAVGIIPVPARGIIMLRATASVTKNRIPHLTYDKTAEYAPDKFDQEAMKWVADQVIEMTAITLAQQD